MRIKPIIAAAVMLGLVAVFTAMPAVAQDKKAADAAPICANCHELQHKSIFLNAHGAKNDASGSSCQGCHGDASDHLKDPSKAKPISALTAKDATTEQKSAVCLTCHASSRHLDKWKQSVHRKVDVGCTDCHAIHGTQSAANNKMIKGESFAAAPFTTTQRNLAYKTCVGCHKDVRAEILKPSHHPIVEGKVSCQDCHDPHGGLGAASLRAESITDLCVTCHADKRGPWIHEHPPVMENCATCHTPHGSAHNRMLAQKPPALCADCHPGGHTHGIYDGRGSLPGTLPSNIRFEGSGCVGCHRQIHGSNAPPSAYGQFFLR
jgi:DmsE family decaheme c-type cytochrome